MHDAHVFFDTHHHVGQIDRRIFSGFLEHLGRAVYEGVYDPGNPLSNDMGFRRDVLDTLRPLQMPLVRYPGGNFVSCYDWRDGVGPREKRPVRPDYAWKSRESNQFGTDEFMQWCEQADTAPMMAVNLGTGDAAGAAALLEYCNLPAGTHWADLRRQHGHEQPYNVKTWCLGNEMDGDWQAGHVPAEVYAQRAKATSIYMKGLDSTIETIACGSSSRGMSTYLRWDATILDYCWDNIDYISAHRYSDNHRDDSARFLAEGVVIDRILEDYAGLINYIRGAKRSNKHIYLSFDEWNVWYKNMEMDGKWQHAPHLLEEVYNLEDALVCAQYLNSFIRRADLVKIACIAQIVNVIAPVLTRQDGLLIQSIYYPLALYAQHARGLSLVPAIQSSTYHAGDHGEVPVLDASMSYDPDTATATAFLVNRSQAEATSVELAISDCICTEILGVDILTGEGVKTANTWENPDQIRPVSGRATITATSHINVQLPTTSMAVVRARVKAR